MKIPFTFTDGPLAGAAPRNSFLIDSALVGLTPVVGDKRFIMAWDRTRIGKGYVAGLYKFVLGEDGKVIAVHVPGPDDKNLDTAAVEAEKAARVATDAVRKVQELATAHPEVAALLK